MNRTVKFLGYAYSESTVDLEVTAGGNIVFSGSVPVLGTDVSEQATVGLEHPDAELFTFELPVEFSGSLPMSITPTGGSIVLAPVYANYNAWTLPAVPGPNLVVGQSYTIRGPVPGPGTVNWTTIGAPDNNPGTTFTATGQAPGIGEAYPNTPPGYTAGTSTGFAEIYFSGGQNVSYRTNPMIDGIAQPDAGDDGAYWWAVGSGSTITFDLLVDAGTVA
jgi:hypothetical protein